MTLKLRRLLSIVFIFVFIAITPAIMLYAAGYRLSPNGLSVQRTGMFIIDSNPPGAKIIIDGQPQENWYSAIFNKNNFLTTPAKIKNLLPGEYNLKLELNGYWNWQKKLAVNPGTSTFAENIYLFKNELPLQLASADPKAITLSPKENSAVVFSENKIAFINLGDETEKSAAPAEFTGKNIAWSGGRDKAVIDKRLYSLSDLNSSVNLIKLFPNLSDYRWSGDALYARDKNSIYRINAETTAANKITSGQSFNDYLAKNGFLYLISRTSQAASLKIINESSGQTIKEITLPSADYSFINSERALLNLYDNGNKILYLIDPSAAYLPLVDVLSNVKITYWADEGNLLYANDFEIWLYSVESKNKTLITRISEVITGLILHQSIDYIIYSTDHSINAIELDEREKRNSTELVKFDSIGSLSSNSKGDVLYFSGKIGNAQGLYKFLIQ